MTFLRKTAVGKGQNFLFPRNDPPVIYVIGIDNRAVSELPAANQSETNQMSWINEQWLTCKSRKTLIWRVAKTSVSQGKYLPEVLA